MSFIISFQGQFRPYSLPDLTHYDHIHSVYTAEEIKYKKEINDQTFKKLLNEQSQQKNKKGLSVYKKQDKEFKTNSLPHHAKDIMSRSLRTMGPEETIADVINFQKKYSYKHIPILSDKNLLVGILSDRDTIRVDSRIKIKDIMTIQVLTCLENTRIQDISKIMLHDKISAIPIINDQYKLTGIITRADILGFMTRVISVNQLI